MGLLGFGKKKDEDCGCSESVSGIEVKEEKVFNENGEEMARCDCGSMCTVSDIEAKKAKEKASTNGETRVKVLGSGCKKCNELEAATKEALEQLNMNTNVEHVTDFVEIAGYGVMSTPALVVDGKVVSVGKVLKVAEVVALLEKANA